MGLGHFAQDDYGSIFALRNAVREARHAFGEEIQRLSSQPTVEGPSADKAVWPRRLGLWATYLFAFLSLLGTSPATVALAALTLAFLWDFRDWRRLGRDPLVRVCLVFGGYVAVHSLIVYFGAAEPELTGAAADAGFDWLKLLLFIPFAYWVRGCPRRIGWLLLLALLGFTTGILRKIDWGSFDESFFHTRFEVYLPAISFGMFTALGALGLIALRSWVWDASRGGIPRWLMLVGWLFLLAVMLEGLLLSYSRGAWVAFAVALGLLVLLEWHAHRRLLERSGGRRVVIIGSGVLAAAAIGVFLVTQSERIADRMMAEEQTLTEIAGGSWSDVPSNSVGLRVHALRFAAHLLSERPLLGWGAGSSRYLLAHSDRSELRVDETAWLPHLHNAYAEILVQFGLVGFVLATALVWLLVRAVAVEGRAGRLPGALARYLLVSMVFVLIWNLINYRIVRHDWLSFWILYAGIAFSFPLRTLIEGNGKGHPVAMQKESP